MLPLSVETKEVSGAKAIRRMIESLFQSQRRELETVYGISDFDRLKVHFPEFEYSSGNNSRLEIGIKSRLIYTCEEGPVFKHTDRLNDRESRYFSPDRMPYQGDLTILGDWVIFVSLKEATPKALAAKNPILVSQFTQLFEYLWNSAAS